MTRVLLMLIVASHCATLYAQQSCDTGISFSGPIIISVGGTYSGNWESKDPSLPAVTIRADTPVTIVNSRLKGSGDILTQMWNGQVTIKNSCFIGTNPNIHNVGKGSPIRIQNPTDLVVENNDFVNTGGNGVSVTEYWGNFTFANTIKIRFNRFINVDGRYSDGHGGYLTSDNGTFSHAVILSLVKHVPGIEIAWNQVINTPGQSQVTDSINLYSSSGTALSHLLVHDNYIQGQYAADPTNPDGLGYGGTAIVTDDEQGITDPANATSYVDLYNNQVTSIGLAGISISAGHDNTIYNNRVVSSGLRPDGKNISSIYAAGIETNNYLGEPSGVYGNNSVFGNISGCSRPSGSSRSRQDYYFGVTPTYALNNTSFTPTSSTGPTAANESNESQAWTLKLLSQGVSIGSTLIH